MGTQKRLLEVAIGVAAILLLAVPLLATVADAARGRRWRRWWWSGGILIY
jgi:hypothetical protein